MADIYAHNVRLGRPGNYGMVVLPRLRLARPSRDPRDYCSKSISLLGKKLWPGEVGNLYAECCYSPRNEFNREINNQGGQ